MRKAIRQTHPNLCKNKNWLLHHDNAFAHESFLVREFLAKNNTIMLPQPPYSPDLAPCDFFLFQKLKRQKSKTSQNTSKQNGCQKLTEHSKWPNSSLTEVRDEYQHNATKNGESNSKFAILFEQTTYVHVVSRKVSCGKTFSRNSRATSIISIQFSSASLAWIRSIAWQQIGQTPQTSHVIRKIRKTLTQFRGAAAHYRLAVNICAEQRTAVRPLSGE